MRLSFCSRFAILHWYFFAASFFPTAFFIPFRTGWMVDIDQVVLNLSVSCFELACAYFFLPFVFFFHRWIAWFVLSIAFNWMPFYIHWELFIRDLNSYRNAVCAFSLIPLVWFGFVLMFPRLFMHYNRITGRRLAWRIVIVAKRRELIVLNTGLVWCCCCCFFFESSRLQFLRAILIWAKESTAETQAKKRNINCKMKRKDSKEMLS